MNTVKLKTYLYLGDILTRRNLVSFPPRILLNTRPLCLSPSHYVHSYQTKMISEPTQTNMGNRGFTTSPVTFCDKNIAPPISKKDKLKKAVADYGSTVIVFHVAISLVSLGVCYLIVSSGVDLDALLTRIGLGTDSSVIKGGSTFVVAYAIHKVFAPVRISITLASCPFIVRYLRAKGILKSVPKKV